MDTMNVSLPVPMKDFVEQQVKSGGYGTASEYVRQLIREDQEKKQRRQVDSLILEALQSGKPIEVTPAYWQAKKKQLAALAKGTNRAKKRA